MKQKATDLEQTMTGVRKEVRRPVSSTKAASHSNHSSNTKKEEKGNREEEEGGGEEKEAEREARKQLGQRMHQAHSSWRDPTALNSRPAMCHSPHLPLIKAMSYPSAWRIPTEEQVASVSHLSVTVNSV